MRRLALERAAAIAHSVAGPWRGGYPTHLLWQPTDAGVIEPALQAAAPPSRVMNLRRLIVAPRPEPASRRWPELTDNWPSSQARQAVKSRLCPRRTKFCFSGFQMVNC